MSNFINQKELLQRISNLEKKVKNIEFDGIPTHNHDGVSSAKLLDSSDCYGNMYGTSYTVDVPAGTTGAVVEVDGGLSAGELKNCTFPGDHYLQVGSSGDFFIVWNISYQGGGNEVHEAGIMIDGSVSSVGKSRGFVRAVSPLEGSNLSSNAILTLSSGSEVGMYVKNTSNDGDVSITLMSLSLLKIS